MSSRQRDRNRPAIWVTADQDQTSSYSYDKGGLNELQSVTIPMDPTTSFGYDGNGTPPVSPPMGH